jgi:hypothetical protein
MATPVERPQDDFDLGRSPTSVGTPSGRIASKDLASRVTSEISSGICVAAMTAVFAR